MICSGDKSCCSFLNLAERLFAQYQGLRLSTRLASFFAQRRLDNVRWSLLQRNRLYSSSADKRWRGGAWLAKRPLLSLARPFLFSQQSRAYLSNLIRLRLFCFCFPRRSHTSSLEIQDTITARHFLVCPPTVVPSHRTSITPTAIFVIRMLTRQKATQSAKRITRAGWSLGRLRTFWWWTEDPVPSSKR